MTDTNEKLTQENGVEIADEKLESVAGGAKVSGDQICPLCGSANSFYKRKDVKGNDVLVCTVCGYSQKG